MSHREAANGAETVMRNHHRRRVTDKPATSAIKRRILLIVALVAGIIVAGVSSIRTADAVGVYTAATAANVEPTHVIALVRGDGKGAHDRSLE